MSPTYFFQSILLGLELPQSEQNLLRQQLVYGDLLDEKEHRPKETVKNTVLKGRVVQY